MGRPGFWQFVFVVALIVIFFHRPLIAWVRRWLGRAPVRERPAKRGEYRCAKCGARLPSEARFCSSCGKPQDVIDV